jgi:hypothetical protein
MGVQARRCRALPARSTRQHKRTQRGGASGCGLCQYSTHPAPTDQSYGATKPPTSMAAAQRRCRSRERCRQWQITKSCAGVAGGWSQGATCCGLQWSSAITGLCTARVGGAPTCAGAAAPDGNWRAAESTVQESGSGTNPVAFEPMVSLMLRLYSWRIPRRVQRVGACAELSAAAEPWLLRVFRAGSLETDSRPYFVCGMLCCFESAAQEGFAMLE